MATMTAKHSPPPAAVHESFPISILDDDSNVVEMLGAMTQQLGFDPIGTRDPQQVLALIAEGRCRVVLADLKLSEMEGFAFLEQALERDPGVYVLLMADYDSLDSAIEAIKRGAYDYLPKPIDRARLKRTLDEIADSFRRRKRIRDLEQKLLTDLEFHGIVGRSPAMVEMFELLRKVARHYTNVLISGATGTGKELVAHALHLMSPVAQQRFAVCNCSAIVDTLLESQLFGHVRGSFTGATETRAGLFEYANGGTVFLDEISETSPAMQAKLLRVIQNREIQRVGSPETRTVNVRLIAATNRDLRAYMLAGRFREDLYYRLSTIQIRVPSLSERLDDIPLLIQFFLKKYNEAYAKNIRGLTRRAQTICLQHPWPGNVRELENVISSACLTTASDFIDLDDLPEEFQKPAIGVGARETWRPMPLEEVRRLHIERVLETCQGNRVRTAQVLGIGRTSLYRFLRRAQRAHKAGASAG